MFSILMLSMPTAFSISCIWLACSNEYPADMSSAVISVSISSSSSSGSSGVLYSPSSGTCWLGAGVTGDGVGGTATDSTGVSFGSCSGVSTAIVPDGTSGFSGLSFGVPAATQITEKRITRYIQNGILFILSAAEFPSESFSLAFFPLHFSVKNRRSPPITNPTMAPPIWPPTTIDTETPINNAPKVPATTYIALLIPFPSQAFSKTTPLPGSHKYNTSRWPCTSRCL